MKGTTPKQKRRCCGLDVHKEMVVVSRVATGWRRRQATKEGLWHVPQRSEPNAWMAEAMEGDRDCDGVHRGLLRPLWNVLEGHGFHLVLANPKPVKALHGRKSDKGDSQRIAEFLQDRRIDPSFVPPPEIRRLRDLLRYRVSLLEQRNETHNKIRDLFETANIKLSWVASDLLGVTGQRIMEALIAGETSPDKLSGKVKGRLRKKEKEVGQSLVGCFDKFHRQILELLGNQYKFLSGQIEQVKRRPGWRGSRTGS